MIAHAHLTHVLDLEALAAVFVLAQLAPVSIGILEALKTLATFETGKTWFHASFQAARRMEKAGSVQPAQGFRVLPAKVTEV